MNDMAVPGCTVKKPLKAAVRAVTGKMAFVLILAVLSAVTPGAVAKGEFPPIIPQAGKTDSVKLKSPGGAALRSFLVPGWGQWYNERKLKSAGIFIAEGAIIAFAVRESRRFDKYGDERAHKQRNTLYWWTFFLHAAAAMDAYVDASLLKFDENMDISMERTEHAWAMTLSYSW